LPAQTSADAVAAASAIAAARANAMLVAQGKAQTDTDGASSAGRKAAESRSDAGGDAAGGSHGHDHGHGHSIMPIRESKERDEFVADIDINDVKHRYILTKGSVQTGVCYVCTCSIDILISPRELFRVMFTRCVFVPS